MSRHPSQSSVACIIPYFNGSRYIEIALRSAFSQTVPFAEVIVVDDGSRPEEAAFLDRIGSEYAIKIVHQANGGQGAARNRGAAETKATLLSFLDQDDFYLPRHNEILLGGIPQDDQNLGFVYANVSLVDKDGNFTDTRGISSLNPASQHPKTNVVNMIAHDMMVLPSCSLVSRKAFQRCGGFDPQFVGYEDDDLFLRIFRAGYSNYFRDHLVTAWRDHDDRATYTIKMSRSCVAYFFKLAAMFPDIEEQGLFYFRDCLIPRFVPITVAKTVRAILTDRERADYLELYGRMADFVCANETVSSLQKWRLRFLRYVFNHVPGSWLRCLVAVLGPAIAAWSAIPGLNLVLPKRLKSNIATAYRMLPRHTRFPGRLRAGKRSDPQPGELEGRDERDENAADSAGATSRTAKARCVYTALIGRYERLNEQEVARRSSIRFICFTDDPDLRSETWEIRLIEPALAADPVRSQRHIKLLPHIHLPEFDQSLYIDNSVVLKEKPEDLFDAFLTDAHFAIPLHSFRETVRDEFLEVARQQLDLPARVFEQRDYYDGCMPNPLHEKPYWSGILLRDHRHAGVKKMSEIWWEHVVRFSRRDQLSSNMAFHLAGLEPRKIAFDNHESRFHVWPRAFDRRQDIRILAASDATPPSSVPSSMHESSHSWGAALERAVQISQPALDRPAALSK